MVVFWVSMHVAVKCSNDFEEHSASGCLNWLKSFSEAVSTSQNKPKNEGQNLELNASQHRSIPLYV
jgi:hypothetical protein